VQLHTDTQHGRNAQFHTDARHKRYVQLNDNVDLGIQYVCVQYDSSAGIKYDFHVYYNDGRVDLAGRIDHGSYTVLHRGTPVE
jgi:hypothetical protein